MKYYIQFYTRLLNGEIDEALASDSVLPLDGRLSLSNMLDAGYKQAHFLRNVANHCGFKVMQGSSFLSGNACSLYHSLETRK